MANTQTAVFKERPWQAGIYLGMFLFIISEAFLFSSLFWTYYYLRGQSLPTWPPEGVHLNIVMASINTAILLASSGAMHWGIQRIRRGSVSGLAIGLISTFALGAAFLGITVWEWTHATFRPWTHAYGSTFFTLTGFHAVHVLGGLFVLLALLARTLRGRISQEHYLAVEVGGLYWHFVDLVWIGVFTTVFIIR
ncbi:MAG: heme-copper oxidase subunit III [Chloroflexi bacterium]|nr:heme-copper oxidase subunit III [Chloroflexota bacterium]